MDFRTHIKIERQSHDVIDYHSKILLLGSCFATNVAHKFDYYKFQYHCNPFGVLFHPLAIERMLTNAINNKIYTETEVFQLEDVWYNFDAHSDLRSLDKADLVGILNKEVEHSSEWLRNTTHVIISLGTSWVYRHIASDQIVANCHKVPQKEFIKELLTVGQITESLEATITLLRSVNPNLCVILTVSPVRHLKDGFTENNLSKSHLISAVHEVTDPRKHIYYFPSYEIMMDELRDYRFYASDMIHPSSLAIDHIWSKFSESWIANSAESIMNEVDGIQKSLNHKPFNPKSAAHQKFLSRLNNKINLIQEEYSHIHFE